jgi:hypothetical protein
MNLQTLLTLMKNLGDKLPQAWPIILNMVEETKKLLSLINGGKMIAIDHQTQMSNDAEQAVVMLQKANPGTSHTEIRSAVRTLEMFGDRTAAKQA